METLVGIHYALTSNIFLFNESGQSEENSIARVRSGNLITFLKRGNLRGEDPQY
jgi:hypothetical protein